MRAIIPDEKHLTIKDEKVYITDWYIGEKAEKVHQIQKESLIIEEGYQ